MPEKASRCFSWWGAFARGCTVASIDRKGMQ